MGCPSAAVSREPGPMVTHSTATPSRCSETSLGATIHSKVFIKMFYKITKHCFLPNCYICGHL